VGRRLDIDARAVAAGLPGGAVDSNAEIREEQVDVDERLIDEREGGGLLVEGDLGLVRQLGEDGERARAVAVLRHDWHRRRELDFRRIAEEGGRAVEPRHALFADDAHVELAGPGAADGVGVDVHEHLGRDEGRAREQNEEGAEE
jgi:hypothetical protein